MDDLKIKVRTTKLTGVTFNGAQENIRAFGNADSGPYRMLREPNNPHDANAIRVESHDGSYLGYVPRKMTEELASIMDAGLDFSAHFHRLNTNTYNDTVGITVMIVRPRWVRG